MSKRKVDFDVEALETDSKAEKVRKQQTERRFKEKHSLDSDEEDDDKDTEKYNVLEEDEIEGQEDTNIDYEEGMKFTAFNMRDEMDDGHFDKDGTFIFNKDKEIADGWMDNVDWVKVKELSKTQQEKQDEMFASDDENDDDVKGLNKDDLYREALAFLKSGETVTRALKRLGGSKPAAKKWLKTKKNDKEQEDVGVDKEAMLKLTEIVDKISLLGEYDIYTFTHEKLSYLVVKSGGVKSRVSVPEGTAADDALDMFADGIDHEQKPINKDMCNDLKTVSDFKPEDPLITPTDEVSWVYKCENKDDAEIHGPYTSSKMQEWVDSDVFKDGVFVRKEGTDGSFYSSRRIDFEMYT